MHDAFWLIVALIALEPAAGPQVSSEAEARPLLERAEQLVREGHHAEARALYARIGSEQPNTDSGKEAAWRATPSAYLGWTDVVRNGPSANRLDIVLMGDGYEAESLDLFAKFSADFWPYFERLAVFEEYASYFNVLRAVHVSKESGVDGFDRDYDTALGGSVGKSEYGHVCIDASLVNQTLARIPGTDGHAVVFVRNGVSGSAVDGIAALGPQDMRVLTHQLGHAIGRLADEYSTPERRCPANLADGPNVAESPDPGAAPWKHWFEVRHPGVEMYEGAGGRRKGAWSPTMSDCAMSQGRGFCLVCREAIVQRIYSVVDPIDACQPAVQPPGIKEPYVLTTSSLKFRVEVLRPLTHALEVRWWVLSEAQTPSTGGGRVTAATDRSARGPLSPIHYEPKEVVKNGSTREHEFTLDPRDLAPGRYRVVCRVEDTTRVPGDKWAWVISDPRDLLKSERVWLVQVKAPR